jgi:hypothetical protein
MLPLTGRGGEGSPRKKCKSVKFLEASDSWLWVRRKGLKSGEEALDILSDRFDRGRKERK